MLICCKILNCSLFALGAGNEVYKQKLPEAFYGMTYEQVVHVCFMNPHLNIMLIAIDATPEGCQSTTEPLIYPAPFGFKISEGMSGYFIAQNEEEVLALTSITSPGNFAMIRSALTQGTTNSLAISHHEGESDAIPLTEVTIDFDSESQENHNKLLVRKPQVRSLMSSTSNIYHKSKERNFEDALLEEPTDMKDHIILCTFSVQDSDELNLHSFVSPLRARTLKKHELKQILIIGNKDCIQNEWSNIAEYDDVYVIDGAPLDQDILKAANIAHCSSCIILGSTASLDEDPALIDKQPILCSLTLTSLDFRDAAGEGEAKRGKDIHRVTELYKEENVQFLDLEDEDDSASGFINSQPFAQGECVSSTVFDSLVAVAYFNPGATALFEKLVTGGSVNQAKPKQKQKQKRSRRFTISTPEPKPSLYRPRFMQISLENHHKYHNCTFSHLFEVLLEQKQLCVGIYRRIMENDPLSKRYVITSPPREMRIKPTDNLFVMISYK